MAIVQPVVEMMGSYAIRATWSNMANGDTGAAINSAAYADRSFQVRGTFGVGGSVSVRGSNDGVNFSPLSDQRGNDLAITAARIEQIEDVTYAVAPYVTAGDGTTSLTVIMFARKGE